MDQISNANRPVDNDGVELKEIDPTKPNHFGQTSTHWSGARFHTIQTISYQPRQAIVEDKESSEEPPNRERPNTLFENLVISPEDDSYYEQKESVTKNIVVPNPHHASTKSQNKIMGSI
ncbi:hypothetical protein RFI_28608 [Reticulomyxa filosa]|uniref:Uncharacterized protein n=1 Tax=Reticulomyxa filosa TaxID=46433 RepID=X6M570_RETFI|nr:hypothetical protein RFI_28608 [Reticulomyxa filosa]|eukprot:ETO08776.1 hypothetical protein RFI_28608 [Reticulomyxa filosa]